MTKKPRQKFNILKTKLKKKRKLNQFRLEKETKSIKDRILRDTTNCSEQGEEEEEN